MDAQLKWESLVDQAPDGIFVTDLEGRYIYVNSAVCRMLGYEHDEIVGKSIHDLIPPEDVPRLSQVKEKLREGGPLVTEWTHRKKDGTFITVEVSAKILLPDGRWQGFVRDITSRKQAEEALRFAEARSSGILSISADAVISVDEEQRIMMFNDGAKSIFGYSKEEAIGAPLDMLIPERFRKVHRQHVERFAAGAAVARRMGERDTMIFGLRKNGEAFPADAAISKFEVGGERILTVVLRDITELGRMEREQRFLAEVGSVLATTIDFEETLSEIAGLAVRDLADLCIVDVMDDREVRRLRVLAREPANAWIAEALLRLPFDRKQPHMVGTVLETKKPVLIEHVTPKDIASWAQSQERLRALRALNVTSVVAVPLFTHGDLLGVLALVSATRAYGPADLRLAEEVAHRAALSIENARLYRAANRAIQVRDDVLSIVAHDLRNPLHTIIAAASLLRPLEGEAEPRSRDPADMIERAARRMNRLIQDLLDVARMEAGRLSIEQGRVSAVQVVSDAIEAQKLQAASASLELQVALPPDLPDVWADRHRLLQVFENLIGNALKFTEPGGRITVGAAPRDGETLFWVADTGVGIAAEEMPHLFDRFWQVRKGGHGGAGLGLSIVKGIVEAHGGRVSVESRQGRGSTFCFTIPTPPRAEE